MIREVVVNSSMVNNVLYFRFHVKVTMKIYLPSVIKLAKFTRQQFLSIHEKKYFNLHYDFSKKAIDIAGRLCFVVRVETDTLPATNLLVGIFIILEELLEKKKDNVLKNEVSMLCCCQ